MSISLVLDRAAYLVTCRTLSHSLVPGCHQSLENYFIQKVFGPSQLN